MTALLPHAASRPEFQILNHLFHLTFKLGLFSIVLSKSLTLYSIPSGLIHKTHNSSFIKIHAKDF